MSSAKVPVSFLIPVKNEERNMARCLAAIAWADEIVVVDSGSTDRTGEISAAHGAQVVQFKFNGIWPKKKNWALRSVPFRHEWVFILDADEVLPPETEAEVRAIVTAASSDAQAPVGYWINRRFWFLGTWLKHAYYPNWNLRLFKYRLGEYEKITGSDTQSGDNEVHEHVVVQGSTARLRAEMDHYAFPDVATFIEKHNRYSNWEARVTVEGSLSHGAGHLQSQAVGVRRKLKRLSQLMPFRPLLRFLYVYFWQLGILDGRAGFYFARLHAEYEFLCVVKEFELRMAARLKKTVV
jgi:glycosyltransferase involved in cell wall biosynthesis